METKRNIVVEDEAGTILFRGGLAECQRFAAQLMTGGYAEDLTVKAAEPKPYCVSKGDKILMQSDSVDACIDFVKHEICFHDVAADALKITGPIEQ